MTRQLLLIVIAVVLFLVALLMLVLGSGDHELIQGLTLGGLAAFAGAHV
jgi:hypothetical protein